MNRASATAPNEIVYNSRLISRNPKSGFTLIEVVYALIILAVLFAGLIKISAFTKFNAEQNLYEVSALNAALGVIEQLKSANYELLTDPPTGASGTPYFALITSTGTNIELNLGTSNQLEIPIITEAGGTTGKTLDVALTPTLQASTTLVENLVNSTEAAGMWITIYYEWQHPRTKKTHSGTLRNMVSLVSTY